MELDRTGQLTSVQEVSRLTGLLEEHILEIFRPPQEQQNLKVIVDEIVQAIKTLSRDQRDILYMRTVDLLVGFSD